MSLPFIFTVMNQKILRLAVPNIISNISVPLLSMVDLAIVGHMGSISFIGAIGVAGVVFNFIYWNFGFLRMGTTGFTAQSYGARDLEKAVETLVRSAVVAIGISLILILLQKWILQFSLIFIDVTEATKEPIKQYFYIRIWSAPCVLLLYTFKGWFLGMQNSRFPMIIAIVTNILNIGFSLLFVYAFQMDFKGVALGTVVAEYSGLLLAVTLWLGYYGKLKKYINWSQILIKDKLLPFFKVNSNIFLRTFCLIIVFTSFTTFSTKSGDTILAVNTLLLQLFTLFSYIMDGFAYAAESLTGKFVGGKNKPQLKMTIQYVFRWGWVLTFLFTILYYF
ncbi:MAG TPA: MATE family efflux transporter, partial [Bacteroidales bacterium]|nr:MATE family efflux transporter [Bacteroidales bacterium]